MRNNIVPYSIININLSKHCFMFEESARGARTNRPNNNKSSSDYDDITTFDQLINLGLLNQSEVRNHRVEYTYKDDINLEECIWRILHKDSSDLRLLSINLRERKIIVKEVGD